MQGFDSKFTDFPDYIIGITQQIWEGRDIASLEHYYAKDIIVRTPLGVDIGNQAAIAATMATLAEFPDRQLLAEDVIWSGTPETGMLSSHRIMSTATHLGAGRFGPATGKSLKYRIIADCHARNNVIDDEWLIRDYGAIVRQLGETPQQFTRQQIQQEGGFENCYKPMTAAHDKVGPYMGKGNDQAYGKEYADTLQGMMNADMSLIPSRYDRACHLAYPGGKTGLSWGDADAFWMSLRSSFPSAKFTIHHQIGREDSKLPPRAAIRFTLEGKHDGWGAFGAPTGASVYILGAAHVEFGPWGIRKEYVLFDEVAVWKQILIHQG